MNTLKFILSSNCEKIFENAKLDFLIQLTQI